MTSATTRKPSSGCAKLKADKKEKQMDQEAGSRQDWEGGGSRPASKTVPAAVVPRNSPAKNLQKQADSVAKTNHSDLGPPKNLQSIPTQDTKKIDRESGGD